MAPYGVIFDVEWLWPETRAHVWDDAITNWKGLAFRAWGHKRKYQLFFLIWFAACCSPTIGSFRAWLHLVPSIQIYTYIYYLYVHIQKDIYIYIHILQMYIYIHIKHTYLYLYIFIFLFIFSYIYIYIEIYLYKHIYMYF